MKSLSPRFIVHLWMFGFAASFVIQTFLQSWFAENSFWGANVGWQNEIAIWNVGMFLVLLGILRSGLNVERHALFGLAVLSTCFAVNHGLALTNQPSSLSNWLGMVFNIFGVSIYLSFVLFGEKPKA